MNIFKSIQTDNVFLKKSSKIVKLAIAQKFLLFKLNLIRVDDVGFGSSGTIGFRFRSNLTREPNRGPGKLGTPKVELTSTPLEIGRPP